MDQRAAEAGPRAAPHAPRQRARGLSSASASTLTCSGCGTVKAKLALSERTYKCEHCGLAIDRDVNAARNLLQLAASGAESLNAREGMVRPRPARHAPPNLEPGTLARGQDRDRRPATGGSGMSAPEHSTATATCSTGSARSPSRIGGADGRPDLTSRLECFRFLMHNRKHGTLNDGA